MQDSLIDQGLTLMLYGMGTVFVFLTILVFATGLMSKLVNKFSPEIEAPTSAPITHSTSSNQPSAQVIKAIKAAITQHRQR